jgi:thiamine-phosphate pyrophosphorylase
VFGAELLIGVSTHSLAEARLARDESADFAVLGPVFETISKPIYGPPLGLRKLAEAVHDLKSFPIIGLGGVTVDNAADCFAAGAAGITGISLFEDPKEVGELVERVLKP